MEKGEARDGTQIRAGFLVQIRLATGLTIEEYVNQRAWETASLEVCPNHPAGGCRFARHAPYARVEPAGTLIARYYCPDSHTTFSLLPDCLASRLSSTLAEVESVAAAVESRSGSIESVAAKLRPDIGLQGAVRWVRRRVMAVRTALVTLKGLLPNLLAGTEPTLSGMRARVAGGDGVLPRVRELVGEQLLALPPYVGLGPRAERGKARRDGGQQGTGADPP